MGFFDFFSNITEEINVYANKGMEMDIMELIHQISKSSKKAQMMGYANALKKKFNKLDEEGADNSDLIRYFDYGWEARHNQMVIVSAMLPVMQRRGLASKEGGRIIREYRNY